jgi:hypothetical protein
MPPSPACCARAVIQQRIAKAFRFAAASAGGDQSVRRHPVACQALPCFALVCVGGAFGLETAEEIPAGAVMPEGQAYLQIWPFHPGRFVVNEAAYDPMEKTIGRLKAGDQELFDALLNVAPGVKAAWLDAFRRLLWKMTDH